MAGFGVVKIPTIRITLPPVIDMDALVGLSWIAETKTGAEPVTEIVADAGMTVRNSSG